MSFGRKNEPSVSPQIKRVISTNPLGDRFVARRSGKTQTFTSQLSGGTQQALNTSRRAGQALLEELARSPASRSNDIRDLANRQFRSQERAITRSANQLLGNARTRLASRFGRSGNSTFGNQLISNLASSQLERLGEARLQSDLLGEDLFARDEQSRLNRLGTFRNVINDIADRDNRFQSIATSTLQNEANRSTRAAISRAQLAQQAQLARRRSSGGGGSNLFGNSRLGTVLNLGTSIARIFI